MQPTEGFNPQPIDPTTAIGSPREAPTPVGSFFGEDGTPTFFTDKTSFGSVGSRLQLGSARIRDFTSETFDVFGAALQSGAGWAAHEANQRDVKNFQLGFTEVGGQYVNQQDGTLIGTDSATAKDIPALMNQETLALLESRGFNFNLLNGMEDFDSGVGMINYFIQISRLEDNIKTNTNGWLEASAGVVGTLGADMATDPINYATLGGGLALRTAGRSLAKRAVADLSAKAGTKVGLNAAERFVLSGAARIERNGTVIGALVDTPWTRRHAALMAGFDAATFMGAYDILSQGQEAQLTEEYLNPDAPWWNPAQTSFSMLAGFGLASGLSRLFTSTQLRNAELVRSQALDHSSRTGANPGQLSPAAVRPQDRVFDDAAEFLNPDQIADDAAEGVIDSYITNYENGLNTQQQVWFRAVIKKTEPNRRELARFLVQKPTYQEVREYLGAVAQDEIDVLSKRLADVQAAKIKLEASLTTGVNSIPDDVVPVRLAEQKAELTAFKRSLKGVQGKANKTKQDQDRIAMLETLISDKEIAVRDLTKRSGPARAAAIQLTRENIQSLGYRESVIRAELNAALYSPRPTQSELRQIVTSIGPLRQEFIRLTESTNPDDAVRLAEVQEALQKADVRIRELTEDISRGERVTLEQRFLTDKETLSYDRPRVMSPQQQADVLDLLYVQGTLRFPAQNDNAAAKLFNLRAFRWLSGIGTRRYDMEQAVQASSVVNLVANMLHPLSHSNASMVPGTEVIRSLSSLYRRNGAQVQKNMMAPFEKIEKAYRNDKAGMRLAYKEGLQVAAGRKTSTNPLVNELAQAYRKMYDDFAEYGLRAGVLNQRVPDFVNITLNPEASVKNQNQLSDWLAEAYRKNFGGTDATTQAHRGAMLRAGILATGNGGRLRFADGVSGAVNKIPTTQSEMITLRLADGTSALDAYHRVLDSTLVEQAADAIHNRLRAQSGKNLTDEARARGDGTDGIRTPLTTLERKIEQDFYLQDRVLDLGVVDMNPLSAGLNYVFGTANRFTRQAAVNQVTGRQDIGFDGLLEMARRDILSQGNVSVAAENKARQIIDILDDAEGDISGRNLLRGEGDSTSQFIAANAKNIANAFVQPGIGVAMAAVEIPASLLEAALQGGGVSLVRSMAKVVGSRELTKETLRSLGKAADFVIREQRVLASSGFVDDAAVLSFSRRLAAPFKQIKEVATGKKSATRSLRSGTSSRTLGTVTAVTEAAADLARMGSGEEILTNYGRAIIGYHYKQSVGEYLPKLQMLEANYNKSLAKGLTGMKALKDAARESGFGSKFWIAQEFMDAGLTSRNFLDAAQYMKDIGVNDLGDARAVSAGLQRITNLDTRRAIAFQLELIDDFAINRIDSLIINPSMWDRATHAQNPIIQLVNVFLSYPRGFRANRLRHVADRGMGQLAFWSSAYLSFELANRHLQSMVFGGITPDQLVQNWEEDPYAMMRKSLVSVPFMGPYQSGVLSVMEKAVGYGRGVDLGGSPALGITGQLMDDLFSVGQAALTDDSVDQASMRRLEKALPVWNWLPVQILRSAISPTEQE